METCYIIGGGPSLSSFDFTCLQGKDTYCINAAVKYVPDPTAFITRDYMIFKKLTPEYIASLPCQRIFVVNMHSMRIQDGQLWDKEKPICYEYLKEQYWGIYYDLLILSYKEGGVGLAWEDFRCGSHSSIAALQTALLNHYTTIYLLGYDYAVAQGSAFQRTHFHRDYKHNVPTFQRKLRRFRDHMCDVLRETKEKYPHVTIITTSPGLQDIIPYRPLENLKMLH